MIELTEAQKRAITCEAACLQIAACAGSGKTEVIARRIASLLSKGVAPGSVVAFTFTEKAAEELKRRVDTRAAEHDPAFTAHPPSSAGLFAGTIHSYCLDLLRSSGAYELHDVLTEERQWALLHRFARRLGLVDLMTSAWPGDRVSVRRAVDVFLDNVSAVYGEAIPIDTVRDLAPEFAGALERYERLCEAMQLLSFDQIILRAVDGLRPGGPLRALVEGRVREVFVDEYQDLNRAQEALLAELRSLGARLTVVGDDDQAIYQWRGGDVSLFVEFPARHGAELATLADNHRSAPSIVRVSAAFARTIEPRVHKAIAPSRPDCGPRVEIARAADPDAEAASIVRRIRRLLVDGYRPGDIAVLYRSVRTSAEPLIRALRDAGIPVSLAGRVSLLDRPETRLVAHVFVLWAGGTWRPDEEEEHVRPENLADEIASLTGKSGEEAARAARRLQQMGQALARRGVSDLARTYMDILAALGLPSGTGDERARQERVLGGMSALLVDFEHSMKRATPAADEGFEWLQKRDLDVAAEIEEERAVAARATAAADEEGVAGEVGAGGAVAGMAGARPGWAFGAGAAARMPGEIFLARLRVFLEKFASQAVEEAPEGVEPDAGSVNVMTIHQAKGLEFPVVFVPCLVDGRFPSSRTGREKRWYLPGPGAGGRENECFDKERYEGRLVDERRLFYVAMTRARELLVLSYFSAQGTREARPSRFLRDIVSDENVRCELCRFGDVVPAVTVRAHGADDGLVVDCGQLLVYEECPRKYYLRYVCGFAPPVAPELGFGRIAHHVVCEMARRARAGASAAPSPAAAASLLQERFYLPFASRSQRQALLSALNRRIINYVKRHGSDLARTLDVERRFEIPLDGARLRGRIDLVLRARGADSHPGEGEVEVEIVDLKTAEKRPPLPQHRNQLRLYAHAARTLGLKPVALAIHDLDSEDAATIRVADDPDELDRFELQIRGWIDGIRRGSFDPRRGRMCTTCDYAWVC